jgi:hypothetical protein
MATDFNIHGRQVHVDDGTVGVYYPSDGLEITYNEAGEILVFTAYDGGNRRQRILKAPYTDITVNGESNASVSETAEAIADLVGTATIDVAIQDQTTDVIVVKFNQVQQSTTLSVAGNIGDTTITLTSVTGAADGKYIILFHPASLRFGTFTQIGAAAGSVITLDTPLDFAYPVGTYVDIADTNLNVSGSLSSPEVFGLRGTGTPPGVKLSFDMTRMIFTCLTDTAVNLVKFGDLAKLTNGLVFRTRDGRYKNIFNVKDNREIASLMYDWTPYAATNPSQGQDGFVSRFTFGGQEKIGVVIRLDIGTDAELLIQDDLTLLDMFEVVAEGHVVQETHII